MALWLFRSMMSPAFLCVNAVASNALIWPALTASFLLQSQPKLIPEYKYHIVICMTNILVWCPNAQINNVVHTIFYYISTTHTCCNIFFVAEFQILKMFYN